MLLVAHRTPPSRAGCERCAAAGARVFEVDLQLGPDGRIVVSHYLPFGNVLQRDNLRLRVRRRRSRDPLLAEVIARVPEGCDVLLDLKERGAEASARLIDELSRTLAARSRFIACGGRPGDLDVLRAAGFRTWRTIGDAAALRNVLDAGRLPDEAVSIRQSLVSREVVDALHEQVPSVVAWTVNFRRRARQVRHFGVDGITTNRLAVMQLLSRDIH